MLQRADQDATDHVDNKDQDAGDCVAFYKFRRTIHGTIEICLGCDVCPTVFRLFGCQKSGVQVSVDRHLFARHRIKREACGHLRNTARALGDNDKVDDHEDCKDQQTNQEIARDYKFAKGLNYPSCRGATGVAVGQNDPRRGHVQRKAQHRRNQQDTGKAGKIERTVAMQRNHQHQERQQDVPNKERIKHRHRQRQNHHRHHGQNAERQRHVTHATKQSRLCRGGHSIGPLSRQSGDVQVRDA